MQRLEVSGAVRSLQGSLGVKGLNMSRTADRGWYSSLGFGKGAKNSLPQVSVFRNVAQGVGLGGGGMFCNIGSTNMAQNRDRWRANANVVMYLRVP